MPWPTSPQVAYQLSERQFQRYKHASESHQSAGADRAQLGSTSSDPTGEHLAAVDQADAALEITLTELDAARADYMDEPPAIV
jgi:hypothetical protein